MNHVQYFAMIEYLSCDAIIKYWWDLVITLHMFVKLPCDYLQIEMITLFIEK